MVFDKPFGKAIRPRARGRGEATAVQGLLRRWSPRNDRGAGQACALQKTEELRDCGTSDRRVFRAEISQAGDKPRRYRGNVVWLGQDREELNVEGLRLNVKEKDLTTKHAKGTNPAVGGQAAVAGGKAGMAFNSIFAGSNPRKN